jgi:HK97 family phage portal protein
MKLFGLDIKRIEKVPLPNNTANRPSGTAQMIPVNTQGTVFNKGTVTWQGGNAEEQVKQGYSGNDIVYSIIRLITDKVKQAPWGEYKIVDETEYKRLQAAIKSKDVTISGKKLAEMHLKALEPVKTGGRITELLKYPNPVDSWGDIIEAYAAFKLITGNAYVYGKQIPMGANKGQPLELWVMPSQYMSIIADLNVFPILPTGYQLYLQFIQQFNNQEILHDKYFNPNWNIVGNQLYGLSPLQAAAKVLTRSNEGKQAAVSNYQNGGPKGILFVADDRYDPNMSVQEAVDIKKTLARNQGSMNVNQVETSGYKVDYVPLGLSPVDLDLLNAENMDLRALCNVYGVPSQLLNDPDNKTFSNTKEGEKALTVRCALPMLASIRDQFNRKFMKDWGNQKTVIDFDITVYQELQEDKEMQVRWLKDAPIKTGRKLEILGESTEGYSTEQLDSIIIGSGSTTLDEVITPAPINIPNGLNDYDQPTETIS